MGIPMVISGSYHITAASWGGWRLSSLTVQARPQSFGESWIFASLPKVVERSELPDAGSSTAAPCKLFSHTGGFMRNAEIMPLIVAVTARRQPFCG